MDKYTVEINPSAVNFRPQSLVEEVLQNVNTIVSTSIHTVPLFREFGLESSVLDDTSEIVKARFASEIVEKVEKYEPRAIVESVFFLEDNIEGRMIPRLTISIVR